MPLIIERNVRAMGIWLLWTGKCHADSGPEIWTDYAILVVMDTMSIQDLKARLSGAVSAAESGTTILITRHSEPVARLGPARPPDIHRGARVGTGRLDSAMAKGTGGRSLAVLLEDRGSR